MKAKQIKTAEDAQTFLEGCVNDLENGLMTKAEFMKEMAEYTNQIAHMTRRTAIVNTLDKGHMRTIFEQSRATEMENPATSTVKCYTCNCTIGIKDKDNYCNMCDHYF